MSGVYDEKSGDSQHGVSADLLRRAAVREPRAWARLMRLFRPRVKRWCARRGVSEHDASDVCQTVFAAIDQGLPSFRHGKSGGAFLNWVRAITFRKVRDHFRRKQGQPSPNESDSACQRIPDFREPPRPASDDYSAETVVMEGKSSSQKNQIEIGHDIARKREALVRVRRRIRARTWQIFCRLAADGQDPTTVAAEFGLTIGAVYVVRSRVLKAVREELEKF